MVITKNRVCRNELISLLNNDIRIYDITDQQNDIKFKLINHVKGSIVIQGIEDWIVEVIRNLIGNAISFSPVSGTIWLEINLKDGEIERERTERRESERRRRHQVGVPR